MKHLPAILMITIFTGFCLFAFNLASYSDNAMNTCANAGGHIVTIERGKHVCAKLEIIK